jgi:haloalkane dehalogenase
MEILRTPDARFDGLPGYGFAPAYVDVPGGDGVGGSLRVHYVDAGARDGRVVLLLHGEPTWSYLYRAMIPPLVAAGYRTIAPDLVGFGRSDKPADRTAFTYARHLAWLRATLDAIGVDDAVLVVQDWGGLLGLRLVAAQPERFAAVVAANTFLPTGDVAPGPAFTAWRTASQTMREMHCGRIVGNGCAVAPAAEVLAGYDAPFPGERYQAAARAFPMLVPATPDDPEAQPNRDAWARLAAYERPFLCAFSDGDPITRGGDRYFRERVPGARGVAHVTIAGAGHFLQEERPLDFARAIVGFLATAGL